MSNLTNIHTVEDTIILLDTKTRELHTKIKDIGEMIEYKAQALRRVSEDNLSIDEIDTYYYLLEHDIEELKGLITDHQILLDSIPSILDKK